MTQTLGTSPAAWTATSASDGATEPCCSVCQTSLSCFEDYNGRPKSRCPQCGSVERQRVFVQIYDSFLQEEFNLSEKHILALSPSKSENIIYAQRKIFNVVSCDVQPHLKTDIVADITNMPNVESAAYDSVIASYVMTCVHDLDSALSEIHRVLKPGGRFLFCDPLTFNSETVEHTDIATITNWYGQETYNRYKVGSFRRLGDVGLLKALAAHGFLVKTFYGRDPITKSKWVWHSAQKDAGATATGVGETMFDTKAMSERAEKLWSANKYAEALNLHRQALENGSDTVSTYRLGTAYLLGFGTPRDIEKAWEYLSKPSQEQGRYACYFRGVILATPDFSAFDPVRAFACFERAAELGVPEAQAELNKLKS
jgi:SAM-dependent methyltransferase